MAKTPSLRAMRDKMGLRKSLESDFDEKGRVCTSCEMYKLWDEYTTHARSTTGKTSQCKVCKYEKRRSKGRSSEQKRKLTRKLELKKEDPYLWRARNIRASLMNRARQHKTDKTNIPTAETLKVWLTEQIPLVCYYTGEPVDLMKMHIDHKQPVNRDGLNELSNLCVTDSKINSAKGAMTEKEFKSLLKVINEWDDEGAYLLSRLRMGYFGHFK